MKLLKIHAYLYHALGPNCSHENEVRISSEWQRYVLHPCLRPRVHPPWLKVRPSCISGPGCQPTSVWKFIAVISPSLDELSRSLRCSMESLQRKEKLGKFSTINIGNYFYQHSFCWLAVKGWLGLSRENSGSESWTIHYFTSSLTGKLCFLGNSLNLFYVGSLIYKKS